MLRMFESNLILSIGSSGFWGFGSGAKTIDFGKKSGKMFAFRILDS